MFYNVELSVPSEQAHNHKSKLWMILFLEYSPVQPLKIFTVMRDVQLLNVM